MSRTYRRNKERDLYLIVGKYGVLRHYRWVDGELITTPIHKHSPEGRVKINKFLSDAGHGWVQRRAPRYVTRLTDKSLRVQARSQLHRQFRGPYCSGQNWIDTVVLPSKPRVNWTF